MERKRKKIRNIQDLRLAKAELRSEISLQEAKISMEFLQLKEYYSHPQNYLLPSKTNGSGILNYVPSSIKTMFANFLMNKLVSPKNKFLNRIGRILVSYFLK